MIKEQFIESQSPLVCSPFEVAAAVGHVLRLRASFSLDIIEIGTAGGANFFRY
jgi:hypothetical protein